MAAEIAAAGAAASAGVGMGLFSYNRGNYEFDQKMHYTRFQAGLNMAIAQTGIYKQDIAQLTALTVTRMDCFHGIAAMGLTILTAIYCPGKLGFHVCPPPGWLMGLEFVNIAGAYLFMGLTLWYCMHASMRADTAGTHMLTRFVRLPIPSQGMLDKARKFLSSYEEQQLSEVLRVPFTRHQAPGRNRAGDFNEAMDIDDDAKGRSRHGYDVPAWYRKEKAVDNVSTIDSIESMMPLAARGSAPEHFEAYREIQMEWMPYDVYARVCIFLAFMHLTHCWAYHQIGHLIQEVRAPFACSIVMLPMFVLQQVILTLDIAPGGMPIQRLGPCSLWFAYFAAICESVRWYNPQVQAVGFVLVYCAYAIHIVYTVQLLRLCAPSEEAPAIAESPGASWWPGEWRLPSAFQHAICLLAPPKELAPGVTDIAGELRAEQSGGPQVAGNQSTESTASEKRADVHRALGKQGESPAWFGVKVGLISLVIAWIWLTFGFTIEIMNQGTSHPSLLNAPGMPNNARDPRYRPAKPGKSEPTEVGTGGVAAGPAKGVHLGAMHRRLSDAEFVAAPTTPMRRDIANKLRELIPHLQEMARLGAPESAILSLPPAPAAAEVQWPAMFQPQLLTCGAHAQAAVALSRHGRGALLATPTMNLESFVLHGVAGHGTIVAASWDTEGLLLVTTTGDVFECAGAVPTAGKWACKLSTGPKLPIATAGKPFTGLVAVSRAPGEVQAAVIFPGDDSVTIFARSSSTWLPRGEVRTPASTAAAAHFSTSGSSLLVSAADGSVTELQMSNGQTSELASANTGHAGHAWAGACRLASGDLARLAVPVESSSQAKFILG
mmetsp:Transcript_41877/g.132399  ORF Transcript_41877/g.132399 Transcript_41877/m.132399 type:complete len:832 (-) Transcript_41877:265-2760(-)